jgi:hypothetical protein
MTPCHVKHLISTSAARQHSAWAAPSTSGGMGVDESRRARLHLDCLGTQKSVPRTLCCVFVRFTYEEKKRENTCYVQKSERIREYFYLDLSGQIKESSYSSQLGCIKVYDLLVT